MKALRILGIVLLSILLFVGVMFFMASVSIKDIVQNQLIVTAFKEGVKEGVPEENKKEVDEIVDKITSYPETNEIIESVINDYANYNTNKTVSDKIYIRLLWDSGSLLKIVNRG